jgi:hypothetical protein
MTVKERELAGKEDIIHHTSQISHPFSHPICQPLKNQASNRH